MLSHLVDVFHILPDLRVFNALHVLPTLKTPFLLQHFRVDSIQPIFAKNNPDNSENPCAVKRCTLDSIQRSRQDGKSSIEEWHGGTFGILKREM